MSEPTLTGSCACGAVRFALDAPLEAAAYCHCTRCQGRTGTAYQASARITPGSFRLVEGAEHVGAWWAGDGLEKNFCRECGGAVFARDHETHEVSIVRMGAIDGDPGVRPAAHQFVAYAPSWSHIPDDGLPRFEEAIPR